MPALHNYRLFISHAWSYSERYERAVQFLNRANNFKWTNYSVPEAKAFESMFDYQLEEELRQQIRPVQCVVVVSGMYVNYSRWLKFEMDFAKNLGKPVLGIRRWGAQRTPESVMECADEMVNWNSQSIIDAIRRLVP
ncbi:TIR domain-containing protein [Salinicola sp. MIT1003]|uniref:TIR domain-containing protein n=1 Tax=Salinicola sp. MIT1003 TaxID=1882734 RepID=UPI0008DDFDD9|nr:TIR domain-containing protein [Salinicola sp. MIT1003]OHZ00177.1 nuclease [Salinicola sp. MIT1003]